MAAFFYERMSAIQEWGGGILDDLVTRGYTVVKNLIPNETAIALSNEIRTGYREDDFRPAAVGRGEEKKVIPEIRSDHVQWLDPNRLSLHMQAYWNVVDSLRLLFNREFFAGLKEFEAHATVYPPDSFYVKHLDQHRNTAHRIFSCILYLNTNWLPEDGGYLKIHHDTAPLDVLPEMGTFVCFRSDTIWHEVLPTHRERKSITGWLRR